MQVLITGKGVGLTDAIEDYVNKKINGLEKFFPGIVRAEVVVGTESRHHKKGEIFFAECKLQVPGVELVASKNEKILYRAVDRVRDHLESELKKYKAKLRGKARRQQSVRRYSKEYHEE